MKYQGTFRSSTIIKADSDGKLPKQIKVLPRGSFHTTKYGELEITDETMHQMISNFQPDVRPVSIDRDHAPLGDTRAAGWIEQLVKKVDGLYADVDWTPYGEKLVGNREYRMLSPEWSYNYVDSEDSAERGAALLAVALTNRPLFKSIGVLTANDLTSDVQVFILQSNSMNLADILAKQPADRTSEEIQFLADHQADMTDEQAKQYQAEQPQTEQPEEEVETEEETTEEETTEESDTPQEGVTQATDQVSISANELARLQALEEENKKLVQEKLQAAVEKKVDSYISNDQGKTQILAKSKDAIITFLMSLNDEQREAFYKIADQLPGKQITGEVGAAPDENSSLTAAQELSKVVDEIVAQEKVSRATAHTLALKRNPELNKRYIEESKTK